MTLLEKLKRPPAVAVPPPARSPERQALAVALAARAEAQRIADAAEAAVALATDQKYEAIARLGDIEKEIATARDRADRVQLRELQQRQMDAVLAVAATKETAARLDEQTDQPLAALRRAEAAVKNAVNAVLASATPRLVAQFVEAREAALHALAQLIAVESLATAGTFADPGAPGAMAEVRSVIAQAKQTMHSIAARDHASGAPWRLAREALLLDDLAPLPE